MVNERGAVRLPVSRPNEEGRGIRRGDGTAVQDTAGRAKGYAPAGKMPVSEVEWKFNVK